MNLSKLLSLSLFAAFVANHQVLGACASKEITIRQTGLPQTTTLVSDAKNVSTHYGLTGGSYTGSVSAGAGESFIYLYQDSENCIYSLVNVLGEGNAVGDITVKVPGNLTVATVQDGGTYTYDTATGKTSITWSFKQDETEGFAEPLGFLDGCVTVEASFSDGGLWMWPQGSSKIALNRNAPLEICIQEDTTTDPSPTEPTDICEDGCGILNIFCWIRYLFQCVLSSS